jgi:site-specific DNA-methyltransferase (adenine-specific)
VTRKEVIGPCTLYLGDCLEIMADMPDASVADMPDASVDSVVTDPPYHLTSIVERFGTDGAYQRASRGFMGKKWDGGDIAFRPETWAEVLRVLKPGGHLLAFSGTRTQHRMVCAIEDAGFEIRDMIAWVYGSGFPKSHNLDGDWQGWGTALKPALEPVTVARKPFKGTVAANVLEHSTGALNIDGCRVGTEGATKRGDGPSWKGSSFDCHSSIEQVDAGRWPANLIHDGSDEVVGMFPHVQPSRGNYKRGVAAEGEWLHRKEGGTTQLGFDDSGSAARFFYTAKASKGDRDDGLEGQGSKSGGTYEFRQDGPLDGKIPSRRNTHPTVKPTDLMRYLCRLVTPPRGIVLDPFMGSGSTGMAATLEGFQFIGCEMEPEYFDIAIQRVRKAGEQPDLCEMEPEYFDIAIQRVRKAGEQPDLFLHAPEQVAMI